MKATKKPEETATTPKSDKRPRRNTKKSASEKALVKSARRKVIGGTKHVDDAATPAIQDVAINSNAVVNWLLASGVPVSVLFDQAIQQLLSRALPVDSVLLSKLDFASHLQSEYAKFGHFLRSYLASESRASMGLPFLSLYRALQPMTINTAEIDVENKATRLDEERAFFSVAIGLIDSKWRKVNLMLATKEVLPTSDFQSRQVVDRTLSEAYDINSISEYTRFEEFSGDNAASPRLYADEGYGSGIEKREDLLTSKLRYCVHHAMGVGSDNLSGGETKVRCILRLLQELARHFENPDRSSDLKETDDTPGTYMSLFTAVLMEKMTATSTSIGAISTLLTGSCARFPLYWSYFQSSTRSNATNPAWTTLTMDDWHTAAEVEAILNHLKHFHLEKRAALGTSTVTPSFAMLFRRLLLLTINTSSFKVYHLDGFTIGSSPIGNVVRRKPKHIDEFTQNGRQIIMCLREMFVQSFPSPTTPSAVDDEIKAMLLDPRIKSKVADIVTDTNALCRAQEALRQEHRIAFELIAKCNSGAFAGADNELEGDGDDEEDESDQGNEISTLMMIGGTQNQLHTASSSGSSDMRASKAKYEDRAWQEWENVCVAWDEFAQEEDVLSVNGKYNLLTLYRHVNILAWFRDVGQHAHPAASLLARIYLNQESAPFQDIRASFLRFTMQEEVPWMLEATDRAEKRCILHYNWCQYQRFNENAAHTAVGDQDVGPSTR